MKRDEPSAERCALCAGWFMARVNACPSGVGRFRDACASGVGGSRDACASGVGGSRDACASGFLVKKKMRSFYNILVGGALTG